MFFRANLFLTFAQVKRWLSLNGTRQLKTADLYFAGLFFALLMLSPFGHAADIQTRIYQCVLHDA